MAPTKAPVSASTSEKSGVTISLNDDDDPSFLPHLPFGENQLHYRRVCAPVHSSILCMTLRFPIEVAPQDPNYIYARPVDDQFYSYKKYSVFIDGKDLLACRNITGSIDQVVQTCLDNFAATIKDSNTTVIGIWTRRRLIGDNKEMSLYGVHMANHQKRRVDQYFDKHVVLVVGASPAPAVLDCMSAIFGSCGNGGIKPKSFVCSGHGDLPEDEFDISPDKNRERRLGNWRTYQQLPEDKTYVGVFRWAPNDFSKGRGHSLPEQNFTEFMISSNLAREPGYTELRKLSIIVEYPLAHIQSQNTIFDDWESVEAMQKGLPKLFMNAYSEQGQEDLFKLGYELEHFMAYDGLPQFNPTETGAYDWDQLNCKFEPDILKEPSCMAKWIPEYGTKCRGPLTPASKLKATNQVAREAFQNLGMDMRFYGRIWEFSNQFWWQVNMWGSRGGLDCTHSNGGSGISCVHKYFLMTMIDDHYENKMLD